MGKHKALSAAAACRAINSSVQASCLIPPFCAGNRGVPRRDAHCVHSRQVEAHCCRLSPSNALQLVRAYDVVVDASDNAFARYLLSDACALALRPLVSGAALGTDGHLTVYCLGEDGALAGCCAACQIVVSARPGPCSSTCSCNVSLPSNGTVMCAVPPVCRLPDMFGLACSHTLQAVPTAACWCCIHMQELGASAAQGRATAASSQKRRAQTRAAAALTQACWAPCRASLARCRRWRPSRW